MEPDTELDVLHNSVAAGVHDGVPRLLLLFSPVHLRHHVIDIRPRVLQGSLLQIESEGAPQATHPVPRVPGRVSPVQLQRGGITHVENMPGAVPVRVELRVLHVRQRAHRSQRAQTVLIVFVFLCSCWV